MIREILFRGKLCHSDTWVYGNLCKTENESAFILPTHLCGVDGHHFRIESDEPFSVEPDTIGQFTGLIDKNGRRIFENDVVNVPVRRLSRSNWWQKTNEHHGFVGDFVYKIVKFKVSADASTFEFYELPITRKQVDEIAKPRGKERDMQAVDDINFKAKETEIIGNVFDNPELAAKDD